jgi:hypothetical protein
MNEFTFSCPHCGEVLQGTPELSLTVAECPTCAKQVTVPMARKADPQKDDVANDLTFTCPHCQQSVETPNDILGQVIECPSCNRSIQLPDPQPKPKPRPQPVPQKIIVTRRRTSSSTSSSSRACPFCGETILSVAIKCKHCGSDLTGTPSPKVQRSEALGIIALKWIFLIIMAALVGWVVSGIAMATPTNTSVGVITSRAVTTGTNNVVYWPESLSNAVRLTQVPFED